MNPRTPPSALRADAEVSRGKLQLLTAALPAAVADVVRRGIARNVVTVFGGTVAAAGIGFLTTLVLVHHFPPEEYAMFAVLDSGAGISSGLLVTALNWWMVKSIAARGSQDTRHVLHLARGVLRVEIAYALCVAFLLYVAA